MKSLILLTFLASSLSFAETKKIPVSGMTCAACVKNVNKAVCEGLKYSKENCSVKMGEVTVTGENIDINAIQKAVEKAGYEVATDKTDKTGKPDTTQPASPEQNTATPAATPAKKK